MGMEATARKIKGRGLCRRCAEYDPRPTVPFRDANSRQLIANAEVHECSVPAVLLGSYKVLLKTERLLMLSDEFVRLTRVKGPVRTDKRDKDNAS